MVPKLSVIADLLRLNRPIGWWLLLWPCWWGLVLAWQFMGSFAATPAITDFTSAFAAYWPYFKFILLFWIGAVLMRGAGCIINDYCDRRLDAQVARTASRPLASGAVTPRQALLLLGLLLGLSFIILLQLSPQAIAIGVGSLLLVATYPLMKRITWWPQLFLGVTFNIGVLVAWAAVAGQVGLVLPWLLYAAGIAWTLGYDTIYALQDIEDDARVGIKSTARLFGGRVRLAVGLFYGVMALLLALVLVALGAGWSSWLALGLLVVHLGWQVQQLGVPPVAAPQALRLFKANFWTGGLVWLTLLLA